MDSRLNGEQRNLYESFVEFARDELNHDVRRRDRERRFSRKLWHKCGERGLLGLPVPEEYGGAARKPLDALIALQALGFGCLDGGLAFGVCAHLSACVIPVWRYGSAEQKSRYLPRMCSGELIATSGMTEPETGSDVFHMQSRAVRVAGGYRLTGRKCFCSHGPIADAALIYAVTDPEKGYHGGITAFLVNADHASLQRGQAEEMMGVRTCQIGQLVFEDLFVPEEAVLGRVGAGVGVFSTAMSWERICLAGMHLGTMERLLDQSVEHARKRRIGGRSIGKLQAVAHRIADMKVDLEAARCLAYHAASQLDGSRDAGLHAAITKLFVTESLLKSATDTVRVLGGYGFLTEQQVERALRDAVGGILYSGTSDIQRNLIAGWLGL